MAVLRQPLLAIAGSRRVKRLITSAPISTGIVTDYVPGDTTAVAVGAAQRLIHDGLRVTINCLGEDVTDPGRIAGTVATYHELLGELATRGLARQTEVAVKLSAIGLGLDDPYRPSTASQDRAAENAHAIATAARQAGTMMTLDMEKHTYLDATLSILRELRKDFPETGVALLAYLHRTEADCRSLSFDGSRVRLCKGAYAETENVALRSRLNVDRSFVRCLKVLMAGHGYPMIATHDPRMIHIASSLASRNGRAAGSYEFQMLYGIRPEEQHRLASRGETTRVYIPYGDDWYGYLMRRLAERPQNLSFVLKSLVSKK